MTLIIVILIGALLSGYALVALAVGMAIYHDTGMQPDDEGISTVAFLAVFWPMTLLVYWLGNGNKESDS